jgi:hypothetical protein
MAAGEGLVCKFTGMSTGLSFTKSTADICNRSWIYFHADQKPHGHGDAAHGTEGRDVKKIMSLAEVYELAQGFVCVNSRAISRYLVIYSQKK